MKHQIQLLEKSIFSAMPSDIMKEIFKHRVSSVAALSEITQKLAPFFKPGDVVGLVGNLGAGKTTFAKALAGSLGLQGEKVNSPTFSLIQEYFGASLPIYHIDFYRIENREELIDLGLEEYFDGDGLTIVEWGDKFEILPERTLWLNFEVSGEEQRIIYARGNEIWRDLGRQFGAH